MRTHRRLFKIVLLASILLTACSAGTSGKDSSLSPSAADINAAAEQATGEETAVASQTKLDGGTRPATKPGPAEPADPKLQASGTLGQENTIRTNPRVPVPDNLFVNWLLPWDAIRPVYEPEFAMAEEAPLDDDELVLGVSIEDEAKAYPITVLNRREMVNDEMAGIPTLVTW